MAAVRAEIVPGWGRHGKGYVAVPMAVIDAHLHLFPDEDSGLLAQGGTRLAGHAGVVEEIRAIAAHAGISRVVVLNTAAAALFRRFGRAGWPADADERERARLHDELEERLFTQLVEQNEWLCGLSGGDDLIAPGLAADPTVDSDRMIADLAARVGAHDVRAIKVHPAIAFVLPDDPGFLPVYKLAVDTGLPVVAHGGSGKGTFYESDTEYCAPPNFAPVMERFPGLRLVVAHLGQPFYDDLLALGAAYPNVWTDLSYVLGARFLEGSALAETIRAFGVERVMFGTDFPFFDPEDSLSQLAAAGLSDAEMEMVTAGNAERLFWGG